MRIHLTAECTALSSSCQLHGLLKLKGHKIVEHERPLDSLA